MNKEQEQLERLMKIFDDELGKEQKPNTKGKTATNDLLPKQKVKVAKVPASKKSH